MHLISQQGDKHAGCQHQSDSCKWLIKSELNIIELTRCIEIIVKISDKSRDFYGWSRTRGSWGEDPRGCRGVGAKRHSSYLDCFWARRVLASWANGSCRPAASAFCKVSR